MISFILALFIVFAAILLSAFLAPHPAIVSSVVAIVGALLMLFLYVTLSRMLVLTQIRGGVRAAEKLVQAKKPNMIVATGFGAVVTLKNETLRRLPSLLISPEVGTFIRSVQSSPDLTLADSSYTSVAYERHIALAPIKDTLALSETAPEGNSEVDIILRTNIPENRDHVKRLIIDTFQHGWLKLAERENVSFVKQPDGTISVQVGDSDIQGMRYFTGLGDSSVTSYLDQRDLELIYRAKDMP